MRTAFNTGTGGFIGFHLAELLLHKGWITAGMLEAGEGFHRIKAFKHLPDLKATGKRDHVLASGLQVVIPAQSAQL